MGETTDGRRVVSAQPRDGEGGYWRGGGGQHGEEEGGESEGYVLQESYRWIKRIER